MINDYIYIVAPLCLVEVLQLLLVYWFGNSILAEMKMFNSKAWKRPQKYNEESITKLFEELEQFSREKKESE